VEADADALAEGLVGRGLDGSTGSPRRLVAEFGLAQQDEGEGGGGVHVAVEEEAQLMQQFRGEEVGLIDDHDGMAVAARQVVQGGAELRS